MKLTNKLLSFLHRVFDKDPAPFLALRLRYDGAGMTWKVDGARLTTIPVGGTGTPLSIDLTQYTLGELINHLADQVGYSVEYADRSELSLMGASVLMDAAGDQNRSNGDHLYGYTNVLWSYLEANARELEEASNQIDQMLLQMSTKTASDVWLDELGGYYGVPRLQGEQDASYGRRIIAEVLRPRGNNVAIEAAIQAYTGQVTKVTDVTLNSPLAPLFNAADNFNGVKFYNSTSLPIYGLFDVEYGYDILGGGDVSAFAQIIRDLIGRLRDAGTHLRALSLTGSLLQDTATDPTDESSMPLGLSSALADEAAAPDEAISGAIGLSVMSETAPTAAEAVDLLYATNYRYNGVRTFNGHIPYAGASEGVLSTTASETGWA